jgi:CheY-like chemotaxis protein
MPKKILIIDDDPIVLKYLENLFTDNGYEVYKAANGVEGSRMVEKVQPDLITLDLEMPEQWGPRFYRRLMKNKNLKDIPVIVISGLTGSQYSLPKAVAHVSKPFDPDHLLGLVREHIGSTALDPASV